MPHRYCLLLPVLGAVASACTSFSTVRSAEVHPGPSLTAQASISTPPGDGAAWFWSFDCAEDCDHAIGGFDIAVAFGNAGRTPVSLGVGVSGLLYPYIDGYVQAGRGENPFGFGARLGLPVHSWSEHQLYGRYDVRLENGRRLLLNPALFYHGGSSPNGALRGHFLAVVQGVGLLLEGERFSFVPAFTVAAGRGERGGLESGPFSTVFAAGSINVTWHRRRAGGLRP